MEWLKDRFTHCHACTLHSFKGKEQTELGTCSLQLFISFFTSPHLGLKEGFYAVLLAWRQVNLIWPDAGQSGQFWPKNKPEKPRSKRTSDCPLEPSTL